MAWFSFDQRALKQIDWWLIAGILVLTAFGILVIYGTTYDVEYKAHYPKRQMVWWAISLAVFVFILFFDYGQVMKLAVPAYLICLVLLVGLLRQKGIAVKGAASWYNLHGVRFQPSEFTKIAVVLMTATYLARIKVRLPGWADLAVVAGLILLPCVLIALQPDLGTAATFLPLIVVMPWAAGAARRIYIILFGIAFLAAVAYGGAVVVRGGDFPFLKPYQKERLRAFLAEVLPGHTLELAGGGLADSIRQKGEWAPLQSRIALGSGRLWGRGWGQGTQTRREFLPEAHTDYIFASCGEQFGFAGCTLVLALYAFLVYRSLFLALRAKDWLGYLLVMGFLTVFITHIALNIGVATDVLPVTGLPLPFLSSGGSFLLTSYIGFALIVNVGMRKYVF